MATFKIGDRVKFLNQTGGGRVTKIMSAQVVSVEDENGFEIPTMVSEILLDATEDRAGRMFVSKPEEKPIQTVNEIRQEEEPVSNTPLSNAASREINGIYLCFVPHNQKWLITGEMDIWLINNTANDIIYNCFLKAEGGNGYTGFDYGSMESKTQHLLTTIYRDELAFWAEGIMQVLLHSEQCLQPIEPLSLAMPVREPLFFIEKSYVRNAFFEQKNLVVPLFIPNKI
ncbi:MAG: DUF2027 domain-containing protein [Bacteroidales bacterium]|jgi:hypothetical protein|nr:DUF2027 domain-containing protein [Bacteroidales bacterium]